MGETKRCAKCLLILAVDDFNYRNRERRTRQSYCRECSNEAWREWYTRPRNKSRHMAALQARRRRRIARNKKLVRQLKSVPCADCGLRFPIEAMDFDHLEDKEALISKLVFTVGEKRLRQEIAKCEVVCSNCHRTRTRRRMRDTDSS